MQATMGNEEMVETFTFRGRSMRDAVLQLKETLGEDAVIETTKRVRDPRGGFVEITARPGPSGLQPNPVAPVAVSKQLGSARGPAAYARTAVATTPGIAEATQQGVKSLAVAQRLATGKTSPFAERAAWLASQIEQRQKADGIAPNSAIAHTGRLPAELAALQQGALPVGGQGQQPMMQSEQPMMHGQQPMMHGQQPVIQGQDQMMHGHHGQSHIAQEPVAPQPMNYANMAPLVESSDELGAHDSTDTAAESGDQGELTQLRAEIAELRALVSGAKKPPALPVEVEDIAATDQSEIGETLTGLEKRMGDLVDLIHKTQAPHNLDSAGVLMDRLRHIGVGSVHAEELASRVLRSVPGGTSDDGDVLAMLEQCIADDLMCGGAILPNDDRRRVLAFVGPTGVGKTTTIAKVASQARLAGKRVALITVDTCRAAAVEQLARYADVLNAPLKVVKDPAHLTDALDEFAAYDVVLVDTNGRNPRAHDDVSALRDFFPTDWGGELVLTLACSTRESDLHTAVDAFGALGIALVCITKTDETRDLGVVYSLARRACRPVAWTTHGRTIPDDIEIAESLTWSRTLVSEISHRAATAEAS